MERVAPRTPWSGYLPTPPSRKAPASRAGTVAAWVASVAVRRFGLGLVIGAAVMTASAAAVSAPASPFPWIETAGTGCTRDHPAAASPRHGEKWPATSRRLPTIRGRVPPPRGMSGTPTCAPARPPAPVGRPHGTFELAVRLFPCNRQILGLTCKRRRRSLQGCGAHPPASFHPSGRRTTAGPQLCRRHAARCGPSYGGWVISWRTWHLPRHGSRLVAAGEVRSSA